MARLIARTLTLARPAAPRSSLRPVRAFSAKVEFIEIDLSEESPSSSSGVAGDSTEEPMGMGRLNAAIHGVIVRRAAPDWLPFAPGGSYWVPQMRRPLGVSDLVGQVVYTAKGAVGAAAFTEEEAMCFTTLQGWPSAAYFVEGKFPHPVKESRKDQTDEEES
ncbi:uncharacterized protein LOC100826622 [Brachypodium distachyon]|uniref:Uncharacterized protein n=1 Tax=Brachypodium distachyon TaxID=15368 RepID=I1J1I8_BRADI|nr:uncharacterized protein LOC100826622 [Brachypodium distachyon]KQJ84449.1 hypothetical protein BRADI_5g20950v3 [Brachypodium distachyon]|eukprot:XP_003580503.1 uncharacterized protein LOC100826622 [Brachypodium distachyon]